MQPDFWHKRWAENNIGFHEAAPNPFLVSHFGALSLNTEARVYVPLAGKSLDLNWLAEQGVEVIGIELNESAVQAFFEGFDDVTVSEHGALKRYCAKSITIYAGDIFELSPEQLGPVDAIYDRAALVALPEDMRRRYAEHLVRLTDGAPQLLVTLDYDQSQSKGPPFAVTGSMIESLYGAHYSAQLLDQRPVTGKVAKRTTGTEDLWLLRGVEPN